MIRGIGFLIGTVLILAGVGQAVARDWTIDGVFLLLCGAGLAALLMALMAESETTAGGTPSQTDARPPDA